MKKIIALSFVLAPLLAGCAGGSLSPDPSAEALRSQSRSLAGLQSQMRKLRRRVRTLNRRTAARANGPATAAGNQSAALNDVRSRIEDVEAALRARGQANSEHETPKDIAGLSEKVALLSRKVDELGQQQSRPSANASAVDQTQISNRLAKLETRLQQLDAARLRAPDRPNGGGSALKALEQRLARLEATQKSSVAKFDKMSGELENDRTLVIDYLEDLDKRISSLEDATPAKPAPGKKP